MRFLNLCCGATRPKYPWTNLDTLRSSLHVGSVERTDLDSEDNYVDHDVLKGPLPFKDNTFDGILASHCVEHWDCHEVTHVLKEVRRVLSFNGVVVISVPSASYFRKMHPRDTVENAVELFGEPIWLPDGETTFMGYAGFNRYHKQIISEDSLWCMATYAGLSVIESVDSTYHKTILDTIDPMMNRRKFSLEMAAVKRPL